MGRLVTLGGAPALDSAVRMVVVQSSNPDDLQTQVQAQLNAVIEGGTEVLVDAEIEGAGDGHTFIVTLLLATGSAPAAGTLLRVWMGANREAFQLAFENAVAPFVEADPSYTIGGYGIAGGDQGTRFCGLVLLIPGIN